jgi:hypothetical protein
LPLFLIPLFLKEFYKSNDVFLVLRIQKQAKKYEITCPKGIQGFF